MQHTCMARVEVLAWHPRAFLYHSFLTPEECAHIIAIAKPTVPQHAVTTLPLRMPKSAGCPADGHTAQCVHAWARPFLPAHQLISAGHFETLLKVHCL